MEPVAEHVLRIVRSYCRKFPKLTNTYEELGIDSLAADELIIDLEDEFKLDIPDEDVKTMHTVSDLVSYVERQLKCL